MQQCGTIERPQNEAVTVPEESIFISRLYSPYYLWRNINPTRAIPSLQTTLLGETVLTSSHPTTPLWHHPLPQPPYSTHIPTALHSSIINPHLPAPESPFCQHDQEPPFRLINGHSVSLHTVSNSSSYIPQKRTISHLRCTHIPDEDTELVAGTVKQKQQRPS